MTGVVVVALVLLVVIRWRMEHRRRRSEEAEARQLAWRPVSEFDARFPADRRRVRHSRLGRRRTLRGF